MYRVEVNHKSDYVFSVKSGESEFIVDAKGKGLTPPDALLAALASCAGVYVRKYAEGAKLRLDNFSIYASAELSKEPPFCFRRIDVTVDLKGVDIDERRKKALGEFLKNCPVHNTLKANPEVVMNIT
ncbi:MAG: OsmC family protein [Candidatus Omnitrophica bacterium]|nr:OsmC family protein [Candidatus Omnitrophota bacterium]